MYGFMSFSLNIGQFVYRYFVGSKDLLFTLMCFIILSSKSIA